MTVFAPDGLFRTAAELRELAASGASNVVLWLQGQNEDEIGEELATLAAAVFA